MRTNRNKTKNINNNEVRFYIIYNIIYNYTIIYINNELFKSISESRT